MPFIYSIKCSSPYFLLQREIYVCVHCLSHVFFFQIVEFFLKKRRHMLVSNYRNYFEKKMVVCNRNHNFLNSLNFPIMVKFSIKIETYNVLLIYLGGGYKSRFSIDHHSACIFKNIISCGVKPLLNKGGF